MTVWAATVLCIVVGISDGDTVKVRCGDAPQTRVRLSQIDAPEKGQPFGQRAKQRLSDLVYKRQVELIDEGTDRYGRTLATVKLDGQNMNWRMVEDGLAWCYRRYLRDKSCLVTESRAREVGRGLWSDPAPVAPWEWRQRPKRR